MPLPTLLFLVFAAGLGAAVASRVELRVSPRPALLTTSFGAVALFLTLVIVPMSVYFYLFHGDWFLLYSLDVSRIPSAIALIGFILEGLIGVAGFAVGAYLVRGQRDVIAFACTIVVTAGGFALLLPMQARLSRVGSYLQFHRGFGLAEYGSGALFQGTLAMGGVFALGLGYLFYRLYASGRRRR